MSSPKVAMPTPATTVFTFIRPPAAGAGGVGFGLALTAGAVGGTGGGGGGVVTGGAADGTLAGGVKAPDGGPIPVVGKLGGGGRGGVSRRGEVRLLSNARPLEKDAPHRGQLLMMGLIGPLASS